MIHSRKKFNIKKVTRLVASLIKSNVLDIAIVGYAQLTSVIIY